MTIRADKVLQTIHQLTDIRNDCIGGLENEHGEMATWLNEAMHTTRKRLRIGEDVRNIEGESPKSRCKKEKKNVLSPRNPNIPAPASSEGIEKTKQGCEEVAINIVEETTSPSVLQQAEIDETKASLDEFSYKDLQKALKGRDLSAKGKTAELRERLLNAMIVEIMSKLSLPTPACNDVVEEQVQEVVMPPPAPLEALETDTKIKDNEVESAPSSSSSSPPSSSPSSSILSPIHTSAETVATMSVVSATKKTNVFDKLLSGGKKLLGKKTPGKTPSKKASKSPPTSASRARGSLAPQIMVENLGVSGAPETQFDVPQGEENDISESTEVGEETYEEETSEKPPENASDDHGFEDCCDESPDHGETIEQKQEEKEEADDEEGGVVYMDVEHTEEDETPLPNNSKESKHSLDAPPPLSSKDSDDVDTAPIKRASSPVLFSPEQPVLSNQLEPKPIEVQAEAAADVLQTVADILAEAQKMTGDNNDDKMDLSSSPSSSSSNIQETIEDSSEARGTSQETSTPKVQSGPMKSLSISKTTKSSSSVSSVPPQQSKADQHREKREKLLRDHQEKLLEKKAMKEKALKEKEAEREMRIREQKEKQLQADAQRKEELKERAKKKLQKYEASAKGTSSISQDDVKSKPKKEDSVVAQRILEIQKKEDHLEAKRLKAKEEAEKLEAQRLLLLEKQAEEEKEKAAERIQAQMKAEAEAEVEKQAMLKQAEEDEKARKHEEFRLKDLEAKKAEEATRLRIKEEAAHHEAERKKMMLQKAEKEAKLRVVASVAQIAAADEYDSYCMSDPEEQEQDDSGDENLDRKAKKRIPSWANKENLRQALNSQAKLSVDPDSVFFECDTCNLEEIFQRSSKRYHKRTSSANWNDDKLSMYDKLVYKRSVSKN